MSVLYFLPWVTAAEEIAVGNLRLVPYERGVQPQIHEDIFLADIDSILGNYGNRTHSEKYLPSSVQKATLLAWNNASCHPTDEDIQANLQVGQQLTFCALAKRRFNTNLGYCNADGYQVHAQCFQAGHGSSTLVTTRRRDGGTLQGLSGKTVIPFFLRPLHVDPLIHFDIDKNLFDALQRIDDPELKEKLSSSIEMFVLTNTDSPSVPERAELVLLRGAFEKALETGYREKDLVRGFTDHFESDLPLPAIWYEGEFEESVWRNRWSCGDIKITRPLIAWVRDFCAARNDAAHGSSKSKYSPPLWSTKNHLFFGSWLFPLVIKKILATSSAYQLTEKDALYRQGCEKFLAHNLLAWDEEKGESEWSKVESKLHQEAISRKIEAGLKAAGMTK